MKTIAIKKILVPYDFSETSEIALSEATILARPLKAEIYLIHVLEDKTSPFSVITNQELPGTFPHNLEMEALKRLKLVREKVKKEFGELPKSFITSGNIPKEIIEYSVKNDIDLIVMGTHGTSGYHELFLGSNAQRVVTLSEVPVMTMQRRMPKTGFRNILLPIDNSLHSREKVSIAIILAGLFGANIQVIGLPGSDQEKELNKFRLKMETVKKIVESENISCQTTLVDGESLASAALEYASEHRSDLIVINTGHESRVSGIFLGAFAQQITNHSRIPVLSFRHSHGHYELYTPGFGIS